MQIIDFKPHSGDRRIPAPQRHCGSFLGSDTHTTTSDPCPAASPGVAGRIRDIVIGSAVLTVVVAFVWWVA